MLEKARRSIFWMVDAIRHKSVREHYEDILYIQKEISNFQEERLLSILKYAIQNVPFYREITEPQLAHFPVMTKTVYKEQGVCCRSKEYLDNNKLYIASTSGSTGTPLAVYQDENKKDFLRKE